MTTQTLSKVATIEPMSTLIGTPMLTKLSDNTLLASAAALTALGGLGILAGAPVFGLASFILPFGLIVEYTNRRDQRSSEAAVLTAFAGLDQVHNGKRWMGAESHVILSTSSEPFVWRLLCRTQRGCWFITTVTMYGVAAVESMVVVEISACEAASHLKNRTDLFAKYFGHPTIA